MDDRRNARTEALLKETLLSLLKKKSLNKLTVAEICRRANLGRGTFYLHYADVFDLYESIEIDAMDRLSDVFGKAYPTTDSDNSLKLMDELTFYIEENKELFKLITRDDCGSTMRKFKETFYSVVYDEDVAINPYGDKRFNLTESIFVVSGIIGVLEKWIADDFGPSREIVSEMMHAIILKINKKTA